MENAIVAKLQFFADRLRGMITEQEEKLLLGHAIEEERKCMLKSEIYTEILEKFEDLFDEVIYKE